MKLSGTRKYKKKETIADIFEKIEKYKTYDKEASLWATRNIKYNERVSFYRNNICVKIKALQNSKDSYKTFLNLFTTWILKSNVKDVLKKHYSDLGQVEARALKDVPNLPFEFRRPVHPLTFDKFNKELKIAQNKINRKQKKSILVARASDNEKRTRQIANHLVRSLPRDHDCPYCGNHLGIMPQADHIYPVSKGGLSTEKNMVYVCGKCNRKKFTRTLAVFIREEKLNRNLVESRLIALGKDF